MNQFVIRYNNKHGTHLPPCRVQNGKNGKSRYCKRVIIDGPSELVYDPTHPLKCGARLWVECEADVKLIGEKPYSSISKVLKSRKSNE